MITEDTVTRGTSLLEAVGRGPRVRRRAGPDHRIVDRGGTCAAMAAEAGIPYEPLLTAEDLGFAFGS